MSDFDTRRVGEIAVLEEKIQALQAELAKYKQTAEKWEPKVSTEMDPAKELGKISLYFGGKVITGTVSYEYLSGMDLTTATTSIVETLAESLVVDRLRQVVQPEVEKLMKNVAVSAGAGKW